MNQRLILIIGLLAVVGLAAAFGAHGSLPGQASTNPIDGSVTTPTATATDKPDAPLVAFTSAEGDSLSLEAADNQVVLGETELEPGTRLSIRLQNSNGSNPFLYSTETTVQEDGMFEAAYDLSRVSSPAEFTIIVRHDGEQLATATGQIEATETDAGTPTDAGEEPSIEFVTAADGNLTLQSAEQQVVRGSSDLPPETQLVVRLRSSDSAQPFLKSAETTVAEDGSFQVTFNMTNIDEDSAFQATVRNVDGVLLGRTTGTVVEDT